MVPSSSSRFHGSLLGQTELPTALLVETEYPSRAEIPVHSHENPYLCLVIDGSFEERSAGRTETHTTRSAIFHPPGDRHADRFHGSGGRCFNVEFLDAAGWPRTETTGWPAESVSFRNARINWIAHHLFAEFRETRPAPDPGSTLILQGLTLALAGEVLRSGSGRERKPPGYLQRIETLIRDRLQDELTMEEIAAEAAVHPAHLGRVFRRHYGCTVGEYVRRLRLEQAAAWLRRPDLSISWIAVEAGFADHSHFTRSFRRLYGCTPSEYRASITSR